MTQSSRTILGYTLMILLVCLAILRPAKGRGWPRLYFSKVLGRLSLRRGWVRWFRWVWR